MIINYLTSCDRSFKGLDRTTQEKAISAINKFLDFIKTHKKPEGIGLKKVFKDYWEIRLDIKNRIIFELKGDIINFTFVGNHNIIKRFLKGI